MDDMVWGGHERKGRQTLPVSGLCGAILLGTALVAQSTDSFAPFYHDPARPEVLRLDGEINVRTPVMLDAALRERPDITTLELHSPGGDVYQALSMIDRIRDAGLRTRVAPGDRCHSACSFLLFAGTERRVEGALGVHQLVAPNPQSAQYVMSDVIDVFARLEVPDEVRRRMFRTPAEQMYVFTPTELDALGFAGGSGPTGLRPDESAEPPNLGVIAAAPLAPSPPAGDGLAQTVFSVKAGGGGDFVSIAEAVRMARDGTRIEVYPGNYVGQVRVEGSVDIVGVGPRDEIIWEAASPNVVHWVGDGGSLTGLTIRTTASDSTAAARGVVEIAHGAPIVQGCSIAVPQALKIAALDVVGTQAAPRIIDNRIRDAWVGIAMGSRGGGRVEANAFTNTRTGVLISAGRPTVRLNRFRQVTHGIKVTGGGGVLSENSFSVCSTGIMLSNGVAPTLDENRFSMCWGNVWEE